LKPSVSVATKKLEADMGAYPGYAGALTPSGETMVEFYNDDTFKFTLDLEGLEANCLECGVHIHSGTTCANASLVGGHYWNVNIFGANTTDDPWSATNGAFYNTHSKGEAKRYFFLDQGYGWKDTVGHAVVIHGINGTRISCGILS
jgi:Cu/Zn superoxide dismutase